MADDFDKLMQKYGAAPSQIQKQSTNYTPDQYTGGSGNKTSGDDDFDSLMRQYYVEPSPGMRTTLTDEGMQQAAETAKLKHEWNKLQDEWSEYTRGRGNRSYLREGMAEGSYQAGMAAANDQRTQAQKRIDSLLGVDSSKVTGKKTDWGEIIRGTAYKGADQFSTSMVGGLNWLFGGAAEEIHSLGIETINGIISGVNSLTGSNIKPVENKGNLLTNWYETLKETKAHNEKVFSANANTSKAAQIVDNFGTSFVAAIPMALEAVMTAPYAAAKAGATATTAGLQYISGLQSAQGMQAAGMMARQSMSKMLQNPQFWSSYVQAIGDSSETAAESGMSPRDAAIYTMINSFFNAAIEVGGGDETLGGIQNFPMRLQQLEAEGGKKAVVEWFKDSVLGEGLEEVAQGIFERGAKAPVTGARIASLDPNDTEAIINPWTSAQEFTGGAVVGGLLGGGQIGIQNSMQTIQGNRAFEGDSQALLESAKRSGGETYARAIEQIEQSAKRDASGAVKLNRDQAAQLYDIIRNQGETGKYQEAVQEKRNGQLLTTVFSDAGIDLTEDEHKALTGLINEGGAGVTERILGMRDAYKAGESGQKLADVMLEMEGRGLTFNQIAQAWKAGANVQTDVTGPVDVNTEEGRATLEANLAPLGKHIDAAIDAYDGKQDAARYSAAMQKAAFLYAANGADLMKIVQDARDGKVADIVGYLTDEQVKLAQEIGTEQREQTLKAEQTAAARTQELQEQAAAITKGQTVTAQALAEMDTAIDVANKASQRAVDTINQTVANLEAMAKANPKAAQTEAYKKAYDAAMQQKKKIEGLQKTVTELRRRKAELEGRKTIQRKKGTVSYSGGTVAGVKYDGVDQAKLTRQQQKVVAMVERLADAVNLDYVFISADPGMGGAYVKGGTVYVNINAGIGVGSFSQTMAAASLSHELTHWMQDYAPEQYRELKDFIVSEILKADPQELNRLVQQQQRWEKGRSLSYEQALDEVVANACQTMLLDSKAINKLARQNMNLAERIKDFIEDWSNKIKEAFAEVDTSKGAIYDSLRAVEGSLDRIQELWDNGIEAAAQSYNAEQTVRAASGEASVASAEASSEASTEIGSYDLKDFEAAKDTDGKPLFQVFAFEHDEPEYRNMLLKWGGMSNTEIDNLFRTVDMAMAKIKKNLEALDYAWEEDIDDRAFQPIKQNSDKLYKVSQDFSTLCRKRLLQGIIAGHLSASLQRGLTKEEGIAVRDALIALQEEGKQIEVACALCYVESARMRSQKAIQEFLNDREGALRNYYANQRGRDAVARAEAAERNAIYEEELARNPEGNGLIRGKGDDATMYDVRDAKKAKMSKLPTTIKKRIQDAKKAARQSYALTEQQQKTVDVANSLPVESFTTPEGLQELAKSEYRDIFNAFVLKVSAASKSKGIENDTWWRAGDSKNVGDALIAQMNAENGLRTQSWSDFTVKHLMDYIAATIEMSTRGAKQHAYTKVIDYVELMGRTGVMINMSLIPTREFNGSLEYDDVEGFKYKEALRLRYKFPETAGTICIGMEVEQIRQLLESTVIDYVIPYHQSGMSKDTRKAMHIPAWKDFQNYQGEKQLSGRAAEENARKYGVKLLSESDPLWHEGPNFSDWFDLQRAQQIAKEAGTSGKYGVMTGGYMAMQDAAERYKQICAERGLMPKFSYGDADFSNDPNYWKLLIDRKMVNNVTGGIIEQKAIKPIFKSSTVRRILNDELKRYGTVKADQEEAIERVTRAFLTGDVKGGMSSGEIAKAMQKPVDNVPIVNITQNAAQMQSWDNMSAEEQEQTIQENKAFNKGQTKTGSPLRTLKGSDISRGGTINKIRYPVGKVISSRLYIHKDYIGTAIKANPEFGTVLRNAENALRDKYPDFEYNCISYHPASGEILFQEAPGFDTEREPMVGMQVKVTADGTVSDMKPVTQIWHHKWQWVDNDYDGFDVRESWEWSKQWLSTIVGASKGGSLNAWNGQLKENGLPTNEPIRFQLLPVEPVQPSSDAWQRSLTEPEALKIYSDMWDTSKAKQTETEEEKRKRDSTQRANTLATYGRIYDILKREGFTGKILDASSGLGLGTQLGRTEYGFDVTDIEPYPDPKYKPMFTDYSTHFGQYDAIISSAVLNVVAQDQRDALVVKMGQLLKTGGKMYVTTRTTKDDVDNLAKSGKNIPLGPHEFVETVHNHYQKGFTNPELKAYLQDALGDEFVAEIATGKNKFNNNTAVIVTKVGKSGSGQTQMQRWDGELSEPEQKAVERFGTTTDYAEAGYILPNGKMLRFTDDDHKGERRYDHRAIGMVYGVNVDLSKNHGFNEESGKHMERFVEDGNIRIDAGEPDLDMDAGIQLSSTKPLTAEQEQAIRDFIEWKNNRDEAFIGDEYSLSTGPVDLIVEFGGGPDLSVSARASDLDVWGVKHLSYEGGQIRASRVIQDIRNFYKTGKVPQRSVVAQFHGAQFQSWDEGPVYNNRALVSEETIDKWLTGGWFGSNTNPNYAQAYIAYMRPDQYLRLSTIYDEGRIRQESDGRTMDFVKDASEKQPIQLKIDAAEGKVYDHEGRHRMVVLDRNGVRHVPVLLFDMDTKYSKEPLAQLKLEGQNFNGTRNHATTIIEDLVPLNRAHREEILEKFSKKTSFEKISEKYDRYTTFQFQQWDDTDFDTAAERNGREQSYARIAAEGKAVEDTIKALQKLTAKQAGTIEKLQKRLQLTKTQETREADARKMARGLLQEYGSNADVTEISEQLKALGDYMLQNAKLDENEIRSRARSIAHEIVESANEQIRMEDETLTAIRGSIKGKKLTFDPAFMGELDQAGGFDALRKRSFGTFTVARSDSENIDRSEYTSVSQFYADLQSEYGKGFFPDLANEGEELLAIAENARAAAPMDVNPFEQYMGEAVEHLSNEITMQITDGILRPTPPTDADRAKSRREALNDQIKELKRQQKISDKDARELWTTIYDLTVQLDKAQSRYKTLEVNGERRMAQMRAEGRERQAEIKAAERAKAAEKIQALKDHYKELQQNAKERRDESAGATKYRKQVFEKAKKLREMLLKNDDKTHVPEVLKAPLAAFLESLDFTSTRALRGGAETNADRAFAANLQKIQQILSNQQDYINGGDMQQDLGGYIDVSPDSMEFLRRVSEMITTALSDNREYTINQMSAAELTDLSNFLSNLRTAIKGMNYFMANARFESVREAASKDIQTIQELGRVGTTENGKLFHAAAWENGTPYYIFRRFGEGGKAIFDSLTRGWEKMALNVKEIMDFTEKAYTDKEVREWQKETHAITLEDGSEITMTTAQIMELSMLLNREQAVKHLSKGGMRIGDIDGKKGITTDTRHHHLTDADIKGIVGLLTPRQAQVAKALQTFMSVKGAEWGNEISMRRFGYRFYTEGQNYYPIKTDSNDRPMSDTDAQQNSMFRLLNLSASKSLNPKASNALIVGDIFDTFANHTSDMAKLNGMGLPILDAIKWFNFKERIDLDDGGYNTRTMQGAMEEAFGKQALSYFRTLMKDINGVTESGDRGTGFWSKLLSNYKAAAVGANLRVAFLQPTSYVRASYLIKPKYLLQAFTNKNAYKEAMENSGTAVWKSLGYYDTNIARGMRDQIKHNEGWRDKVVEKSMALAELGDKRTWGRLWVACKMQAAAETGKTGNELIQATADLFREVIYSSQVMDSTLTRSELMRGKSQYTKALTAFMAEPTLSYNMVMDAGMEYHMNVRKYGKGEAWKRSRGYITKAISVYVCSAAFSAVVESIADAFRDDDDEEDFFIKWSQAMFGEGNLLSGNLAQDLSLFGKLPYIKNLMSALQGYKNKDMSTAALDSILDTYKIWKEAIDLATGELDKPTKTTYYGNMTTWGKIYKTLQGISQLSGIAVANLTRDVSALWNTTVGAMYPEYKVKTYDPGPKKAIQDAYTSGRMSEEEAIQKLLESGTVEDEDKAYWTVRDWEGEDKYSQLKEAALNGDAGTVKQELEQLTAHGVKEKTAISNLKSFLKKAYTGEELDKAESKILGDRQLTDSDVQKILTQFGGMDDNEAYLTVKGWETGDSGKYIAAQRAAFTGDQAAFKAEMQDLASHGVKEKDVRSAVKAFVRDAFMGKELSEEQSEIVGDHQLTEAEARKMLHYYAGLSVDDANKAVAEWKEDMRIAEKYGEEYEKYDLTTAQAKYFYEGDAKGKVTLSDYAKQLESYGMDRVKAYYGTDGWRQTGLTMDQYDKYATEASKCKGVDNDGDGKADANTVKNQKLAIINSLPVSPAVKDAIYRKNNWAESGLKNTPWH